MKISVVYAAIIEVDYLSFTAGFIIAVDFFLGHFGLTEEAIHERFGWRIGILWGLGEGYPKRNFSIYILGSYVIWKIIKC